MENCKHNFQPEQFYDRMIMVCQNCRHYIMQGENAHGADVSGRVSSYEAMDLQPAKRKPLLIRIFETLFP